MAAADKALSDLLESELGWIGTLNHYYEATIKRMRDKISEACQTPAQGLTKENHVEEVVKQEDPSFQDFVHHMIEHAGGQSNDDYAVTELQVMVVLLWPPLLLHGPSRRALLQPAT